MPVKQNHNLIKITSSASESFSPSANYKRFEIENECYGTIPVQLFDCYGTKLEIFAAWSKT